MEKLDRMYEAIEMLEALGMPVSGEQLRAVTDMEKEYLKEEVIPLIKQELEPLVAKMRNKFVFNVRYSKESGLNIDFVEEKPHQLETPKTRGYKTRSKRCKIRIVFPDNYAICHNIVADTLVDVIRFAGAARVKNLGIYIKDHELVSNIMYDQDTYRQKEVEPGFYVFTTTDTDTKLKQIKEINRRLDLGLQIEKVLL